MSEKSGKGNSLGRGEETPSTSPDVDGLEGEFAEFGIKDQTPQKQNDNTKRKDCSEVQRKLFDDSKEETDDEEATDGDGLLQNHPWNSKEPDGQNLKMADTVGKSADYTVSGKWQRGEKNVDLKKIYSNLPAFVSEMKGLTSREELERVLYSSSLIEIVSLNEVGSPHMKEIVQKKAKVKPQDKRSRPGKQREEFMAYSLPLPEDDANQFQLPQENYWYLDCEYMLKMYLPENSLQWFKTESGEPIREIKEGKEDKRWVFIPSFRRANIALLDWPQDNDEIVTLESTLRILVVRPSEFEEYVQCCGRYNFPVISLPQDEIGAGYPRLWIQKIALRLRLDFIWMIDDSVKCFYEYYPKKKPPNGLYKKYRRRPFGSVFKRIENFVKETKDEGRPIAAMSPKRFMGGTPVKDPFVCAPPRIAVFLNIKALKSKEVYYRPELQVMEDMIFGYECEKNDLKVFIDNRVHLQDRQWKDTGARSPSVQQHQPEAAKSSQ